MVKSVENGTSLPPFLVKCYEMVSDESTNELISWTESNDSFIIWDESRFSSQLLPKYFKHSNFSSFVRQLNIYGFRKIDTDRWQFANESFIKGQKHLLKNIIRKKHPQSVVQKKSSQPKEDPPPTPEEVKRIELWKEVENLKTDKNALMQELKKLRQHQQNSQSKLRLLREQLKGMETNQQQMLSFIVMAMQSPEFMAQFFQPKENNWRVAENGTNKLSEVTDDIEPELAPSDGVIVRYQPPNDELPVPEFTTDTSKSDDMMELDFSSDELRDFFMDLDLMFGPMDERRLSLENHSQFVLPDSPENDTMLEQLLLPHPSTDDGQIADHDDEAQTDSEVQIGVTSDLKESVKPYSSDDDASESQIKITEAAAACQSHTDDNCEKVDVLTEQMGCLNSEIGSKK